MKKKVKEFSSDTDLSDLKNLIIDEENIVSVDWNGKIYEFKVKTLTMKELEKFIDSEGTFDFESILSYAVLSPKLSKDEWSRMLPAFKLELWTKIQNLWGFYTKIDKENFFRG